MQCSYCKTTILSQLQLYSGIICDNEHLQCSNCNSKLQGRCKICNDKTNFVEISFGIPSLSILNCESERTSESSERNSSALNIATSENSCMETNNWELGPYSMDMPSASAEVLSSSDVNQYTNERRNSTQNNQCLFRLENGILVMEEPTTEKSDAVPPEQAVGQGNSQQLSGMYNADVEDLTEGLMTENSELKFMDSCESLQKDLSGTTLNHIFHPKMSIAYSRSNERPPQTTQFIRMPLIPHRSVPQPGIVSPSEYNERYLCNNFSPYSRKNSFCDGNESVTVIAKPDVRNACVSTESDPALFREDSQRKKEMPCKYLGKEFIIMQATGVSEAKLNKLESIDKIARPSIDIRMQKVLETIQEDPRVSEVNEKVLTQQSPTIVKFIGTNSSVDKPVDLSADTPIDMMNVAPIDTLSRYTDTTIHRPMHSPSINNTVGNTGKLCLLPQLKIEEHSSKHRMAALEMLSDISTVCRAIYKRKPVCTATSQTESIKFYKPLPQFEIVACPPGMDHELMSYKFALITPDTARIDEANIFRLPIECPDSTCARMIFISDYIRHFSCDHMHLPVERISPQQTKNFFLDTRITRLGIRRVNVVYLLRDKIDGTSGRVIKNFLPLLIMTTPVKIGQLCNLDVEEENEYIDGGAYMLWICGFVHKLIPINIAISLSYRIGTNRSLHLVQSCGIHSIRSRQDVRSIYESGKAIVLSTKELSSATKESKHMLELQIIVH